MNHTHIFRYFIICVIALVISTPVFSQRTITVTGEGKAKGKPDYAVISFAIASHDGGVVGVFAKSDESDKKLRKVVADAAIPVENLKQRTYILKPQYDQNAQEGPPKLQGYSYFGLYEVKVTPLHSLPKVMDMVTSFGAGNVMIESFNSSQLEEINDRAMKNAINDARGKAVKIAQEIGASVGDIVSLSQVGLPTATDGGKEQGKNPMENINANEVKVTSAMSVVFSIQ